MKECILLGIAWMLAVISFQLSCINDTLQLDLAYVREHTTTVIVTNTVTPVEIRTERNIYQPPAQQYWSVPTNWTWPSTGGFYYIDTPCVKVSGG